MAEDHNSEVDADLLETYRLLFVTVNPNLDPQSRDELVRCLVQLTNMENQKEHPERVAQAEEELRAWIVSQRPPDPNP